MNFYGPEVDQYKDRAVKYCEKTQQYAHDYLTLQDQFGSTVSVERWRTVAIRMIDMRLMIECIMGPSQP